MGAVSYAVPENPNENKLLNINDGNDTIFSVRRMEYKSTYKWVKSPNNRENASLASLPEKKND